MQDPVAPPRRVWQSALLLGAGYFVFTALYFGLADRLLAGLFGSGGGGLTLHVAKGWVFVLATAVALFLLVWRLNLDAWRRARSDAERTLAGARQQLLLESRLEEVDRQLRLLVEGSPGFFFFVQDAEAQVTYISPTVADITGRPAEAWLGQHHWYTTANPVNEAAREATGRHLAGVFDGRPVLVEVAHADGHPVLLEVHEYGRFDGERVVGLQGIAHDVTERVATERALADSEQRYRTLAEVARDFIFIVGRDGRVEYVNRYAATALGLTPAEVVGEPLARFFPEPNLSRMQGHLEQVFTTGQPVSTEAPVRIGEHELWLDSWLVPIPDPAGAVRAVLGVSRDATERRRSEAAQAAVREISQAAVTARTLQELFPAIHAVVSELMPAHNVYIALYDPASDTVSFPYWADEVDPAPPPRRAARGLTEHVLRTARSLLAPPEVVESLCEAGEIELIGAPAVDWLGVPLRFHDRTIGALVVQSYTAGLRFGEREKRILEFVSTQIAMAIERTRAEEALRESEERYRRLVELSPDGIAIHCEARLAFVNQQAARLLGLASPELALGRPALDFVHPDDRPRVLERIRRGAELREVQPPVEERFLRADGSVIHVEVAATPFVYQGRAATLVVFRDISERLQVAERLRQRQKLEAVGELAGGVAHDFNNLLQVLLAAVQVLEVEGEDRERRARTLAELEAHCRRGASLTRQLLLFSRQDVTRDEPLDLGAVVRGAADLLARLVPERVRMSLQLAAEPLPVEADRGQLEQVLVNLVLNACDAMPEGGELEVRSGRRGGSAWVEVADTGSGIPDAVREHIFEPFFSTKGVGQGSGLGLAVVHGIVTAHRGEVQLETGPGRGATFRVLLPCRSGGAELPEIAPPAAGLPQRGHGEQVLLVEDEPAAREGLAEVLGLLGYRVSAVESGEAALALPDVAGSELLLTDLALPGISGAELAVRLRERWPKLAVVVMSGYAADEGIRRAVGEGRLLFLQKPFPMATLARELRVALEAREPR